MAAPISEAEADAMMAEAFALLDGGEPERAMKIGRRLEKLRYSGGFEIQALAYQDMEENKKAIKVLKKGTRCVPDVWLLWQLLGNCLSDEGHFEKALAAYDTALDLPGSDKASLQFNRAVVLWRDNRLDEANATIGELLSDPEFDDLAPNLRLYMHGARVGVLNDLGRHREAIAHFESLSGFEEWSDFPVETARLEAKCAISLWHEGRKEDAKEIAARAIQRDKSNDAAQWLVREMRLGDEPVQSNIYDLLIHGPCRGDDFPEAGHAKGFFTDYQVVADDLEEALTFVREFEPPGIRDALEIEEVRAQDRCTDPKGVYWTSGYTFYEKD